MPFMSSISAIRAKQNAFPDPVGAQIKNAIILQSSLQSGPLEISELRIKKGLHSVDETTLRHTKKSAAAERILPKNANEAV